jgi:fatty-acyl-CoA synthase
LTRDFYTDGLFASRAPASVLLFATRRFRWHDISEPRAAKIMLGKRSVAGGALMRQTYGAGYPRTLSSLLEWPGRNALGRAVTDASETLTRDAFQDRVLRVAGGLRNAGVGASARVAIWLPNGTDYLAAIFACARLGALAVHINTRFRAAEVGSLLRRTRAVALVTQWGFAPVDFPAIFADLPIPDRASLRCVLAPQRVLNPAALMELPVLPLEGRAAAAGPDDAAGGAPCLTFTTSGTASGPKLVPHNQQTIAGHAADVAGRIGLDAEDAVLLAPCHSAEPSVTPQWRRSRAARIL